MRTANAAIPPTFKSFAGEVTAEALKIAESVNFPNGYGIELAGFSEEPTGIVHRDDHRSGDGDRLDVSDLGHAVRLFHRTWCRHVVSFALELDRGGIGFAITRGTLNGDELHRYVIMLMGLVAKNAILFA